MKKIYHIASLALAATMFASCSNETEGIEDITPSKPTTGETTRNFPADDGAEELTGNEVQKFWKLLQGADDAFSKRRASYQITDEEFDEIKAFTDELVKSARNEEQRYKRIWNWITTNIKYNKTGTPYSNEPYDVFKNRICICQGYANLMSVMALSQGIDVINVNGYLGTIGGHAWNYVRYGGTWYAIDPTNGGQFTASSTSTYDDWLYIYSADGNFLETDQYAYNFQDATLNLNEVKTADDVMQVPFSVTLNNGKSYQVACFNPSKPLPANVRELYIGTNIKTLGDYNVVGLKENAPGVEAAYVDPDNQYLSSYEGIVYRRTDETEPFYIPAAMKRITLPPMEIAFKNVIYGHQAVEEVIFDQSTKEIQAWAVENCPNLKRAYIPAGAHVDADAFGGSHPDFEIYDLNTVGIKDIPAN